VENPENPEISGLFLRRFAASGPVIADLVDAWGDYKGTGDFMPFPYSALKQEFVLKDLVC
jgi:hypothetical protein